MTEHPNTTTNDTTQERPTQSRWQTIFGIGAGNAMEWFDWTV